MEQEREYEVFDDVVEHCVIFIIFESFFFIFLVITWTAAHSSANTTTNKFRDIVIRKNL